jgi:hypothetical protein
VRVAWLQYGLVYLGCTHAGCVRFGSLMAYMEFRQQNGEIGRAEQYPSLFLLTVNQLGELKSSQENRVGGAGGWGK